MSLLGCASDRFRVKRLSRSITVLEPSETLATVYPEVLAYMEIQSNTVAPDNPMGSQRVTTAFFAVERDIEIRVNDVIDVLSRLDDDGNPRVFVVDSVIEYPDGQTQGTAVERST